VHVGKKKHTMKDDKQANEQQEGPTGERLARFLAHAGVASRRHAEELIASGRVQVNGAKITAQGTRVDPERDHILVDGRQVQGASKQVYLLLHKPAGYVTTAKDPEGRPTVLDLLPHELQELRVYPVGRLDRDTSGVLLLTNDGEFALKLSHPRYTTEKAYEAIVQGVPTEEALEGLRRGVVITEDDGRKHKTTSARAEVLKRLGGNSLISLIIHEGHKRQVRRMLLAVGHQVVQLKRVAIGALRLEDLAEGKWRYLREEEVADLLDGK
jgi:23S rRNA pseudouridine2605 synthase